MRHLLLLATIVVVSHATSYAQVPGDDAGSDVQTRLNAYVESFNTHNAEAVANYWTANAVSVREETGERIEGREALLAAFQQFFGYYPNAQLSGGIEHVRRLGDNVAIAEGKVTLFTGEDEPSQSAYTAVLEKQDGKWMIASSHERDLPSPETPYDALQDLEWFVGTWQDKTNDASVINTVRWSPSRSFLIRSFEATFEDGKGFSGTQIFGWDPAARQIRTWTFDSDGSFGDGTVSRSGDEWVVKMNQMQSDGGLASGTSVITRVDDNTILVQKIGESVDGEPIPASEPITVVRVADAADVSAVETPAVEGAGR